MSAHECPVCVSGLHASDGSRNYLCTKVRGHGSNGHHDGWVFEKDKHPDWEVYEVLSATPGKQRGMVNALKVWLSSNRFVFFLRRSDTKKQAKYTQQWKKEGCQFTRLHHDRLTLKPCCFIRSKMEGFKARDLPNLWLIHDKRCLFIPELVDDDFHACGYCHKHKEDIINTSLFVTSVAHLAIDEGDFDEATAASAAASTSLSSSLALLAKSVRRRSSQSNKDIVPDPKKPRINDDDDNDVGGGGGDDADEETGRARAQVQCAEVLMSIVGRDDENNQVDNNDDKVHGETLSSLLSSSSAPVNLSAS